MFYIFHTLSSLLYIGFLKSSVNLITFWHVPLLANTLMTFTIIWFVMPITWLFRMTSNIAQCCLYHRCSSTNLNAWWRKSKQTGCQKEGVNKPTVATCSCNKERTCKVPFITRCSQQLFFQTLGLSWKYVTSPQC